MHVDVVLRPIELSGRQLIDRTAVVLDVLRATTTMAAAINAGVCEIEVFDSIDAARAAQNQSPQPSILCGEANCLPPEGFDLGNSPDGFTSAHRGRRVKMATTNGTRAIFAAMSAKAVLVGALVNAGAVARAATRLTHGLTLLCAGTGGEVALEDLLGAGAIIHFLRQLTQVELESDRALLAQELFVAHQHDLRAILWQTQGGKNVAAAGLKEDITFAARLNAINVTGLVTLGVVPLVRRCD